MSNKELKYIVVDADHLSLSEQGNIGDVINLKEVTQIDTSNIIKKINDVTNTEISKLLDKNKADWEIQKNKELADSIKLFEANKQKELLLKDNLIKEAQQRVKSIENEIQLKYVNKVNELESKIQLLNNDIKHIQTASEDKLKVEIGKIQNQKDSLINDLKKELNIKEEKIKGLEREKTTLNIKEIGEDLEVWCKRQYDQLAVAGFDNTTFDKTNKDIDGSKPDYLFSAFAKGTSKPIVKVVCEMKSEAIVEGNKKKNSDHYAKLNSDRIKHGGEESYALLVSELEKDNSNIIERVVGYDKMYMVRPAYFIPFLSLVYSLSSKFEDVVLESIEFESKEEILRNFESMKKDIIEVTFKRLSDNALKTVDKIAKIKNLCSEIENEHIEQIMKNMKTIKNKIDGFAINKIIKEIERLD